MPADGFDRNGKGIMPKPCQEQVPFPVVIAKAIKQAPMVWRGKNVMMPRFQFGAIASETHHLTKSERQIIHHLTAFGFRRPADILKGSLRVGHVCSPMRCRDTCTPTLVLTHSAKGDFTCRHINGEILCPGAVCPFPHGHAAADKHFRPFLQV